MIFLAQGCSSLAVAALHMKIFSRLGVSPGPAILYGPEMVKLDNAGAVAPSTSYDLSRAPSIRRSTNVVRLGPCGRRTSVGAAPGKALAGGMNSGNASCLG